MLDLNQVTQQMWCRNLPACEYLTEYLSRDIPSFTDEPCGGDKSRMIRQDPYFLGTAPNGDQFNSNSGVTNGPDVWPLSNSLEIAAETSVGCSLADNKLLDNPNEK